MINATLENLALGNRSSSDLDDSEDRLHIPNLVDEFTQKVSSSGTKKLKFRAINRESGADLIARLENAAGIEKPAIKATSKTISGAAEKTAEKTFSSAATSQISSAVSYSSAPVRKFGESPDALKKLISELREHSKNSETPASKLPERTGQNSASESVSEGIHIERYDKKSQYDILREMFSGRDRAYATLKEFMQNTLEKKLEKINRSRIIFKIDSAPQLINYCFDFEKKVADKVKKGKSISESFERQVSEMRESLKGRISSALGGDYYDVLKSVIDRDEKFYEIRPELMPVSLSNKVSVYNAVNKMLEEKTKPENRIRSEVANLSEIMYSGKKWTQRVDDLQNALNQIYNSSRKCALNDRELLAVSLIKNELANNRYIHGKKTEYRDEEGNLQVTYTGIRKTKDMNNAANYLRFNSKIKNALTGLDSLAGEGPGILAWPSSAAAKLTDTFSETVMTVEHTCHETANKAKIEISERTDRALHSISEQAEIAKDAFRAGYAAANAKVGESLSKSIAYTNSIFGKIFAYLANQAAAKGKSLNEFLTEYYNAGASKYRPENMIGRIEPGTVTLQSLTEGIRLPKLSVGDIRLPKLSDYAINSDSIKKAKTAVEYSALAASLIFVLYTGKILANAAVSAHSQWRHRPAASQELTSEQRAKRITDGFESAQKHSQELAAVQQAGLETIAREEYQKNQETYIADRQHKIDTWFDYPIANWQSNLNSRPGWRLNPFHKNTCRRIINSGWKAPGWCWENHDGYDIDGETGDNELAFDKGIVVHAGWINGYGNTVIILHPNGYSTLYAHGKNRGIQVEVGQEVKRGQLVMLMGSTGRSSGSHLHFELRDDNGKTLNALNKGVMNAYLGPETLEQLAQVDYIQDPKKIEMPGWLWKRGRVSKGTADAANAYLKKHAETAQLYSAKPKSLITAGGGSIGPKQGVYTQKTR